MCQLFCTEQAYYRHRPDQPDERTPESMSHRIPGLRLLWVLIATLLALGCTPVPSHPQIDALEQGFSGRQARAHVDSIEDLYPRLPRSRSDKIARAYLAQEFRLSGAKVRMLEEGDQRHLIAERQGVSADVVLLVAAYPALQSDVWVDDSGSALLLEFARVLGSPRPPYTLRFALAETRPEQVSPGAEPAGEDPVWRPVLTPANARRRLSEAGHSLARAIEAAGEAGRVRAVIVFDTSTQTAGLHFARDLRSHPEFRKLFWQSAAELGFDSMFPPDGNWISPDSLHLGFRERSMDRVLALVHEQNGDLGLRDVDPATTRVPGEVASEMFDSIGAVTVEALTKLMRRFEKVDAFSR
jgi:hypothetical protein